MLHTYTLGVLLCVAGSYALYDSSSDVVQLNPSNFEKLVLKSDEIWVVEFYAPWCGHCKNLVPEYKKAATALKGIAKVGAFDANEHRDYAHTYGVSGFPTIKLFNGKKHTPFQGQRTAEKFVDAALQLAKEKAYGALGKKSGGSSSDKGHNKNVYGHHIPWKEVKHGSLTTTVKPIKRTANILKKTANTSQNKNPIDIKKFNQLQLQLFRRKLQDLGRPKVIKAFLTTLNTTLATLKYPNKKKMFKKAHKY